MANKKYSAAIICGHGKSSDGSWDPGCTYKTGGKKYTEAELMLPITKAFVKYAKLNGIEVYTDASGGNMKNMNKTISEANAKGVDVYISLHADWEKAPTGTYPYYYKGSGKGKKLANCLNKAVMKDMGIKTRKLHTSTDLGEVSSTNMPSCIFETGSIKADLKMLRDKPEAYGKALAKGLCSYFGIKFKDDEDTNGVKTPFKIRAKKNLIVRTGSSLTSAKMKKIAEKGEIYTIVAVRKNRGELKAGGWITLSKNYVERI